MGFLIENVPVGTYLLQVTHPTLQFDSVLVEISSRVRITASFTDLEHGKHHRMKYPLHLQPAYKVSVFKPKEEFKPQDMLKNPMVLVGCFLGLMMFVMPLIQPDMEEM